MTEKATNPNHTTQVFKTTRRILGFLMDFARLCSGEQGDKTRASIDASQATNSRKRRKKTESKKEQK